MILKLPYGAERLMVDLRGMRVRQLAPSAPSRPVDVQRLVARAVDSPLDGQDLRALSSGRSSAVIVVPDATRRVNLPAVLPVLTKRIRAASPGCRLCLVIACGTHPAPAEGELAELLGPLPADVEVCIHDSRDENDLVPVGEITPGRALRLHRVVAEAELLITIGAVKHHYFAGFGGGPKMIFPGCAGYEEIQANHSLVLSREGGSLHRHPGCEPGLLDGNPVAAEIAQAADLRPPDMALCMVPNAMGSMAWAVAGSWRAAFSAAVGRVRELYEVAPESFRLVVASGGGQPGDATLIQAHKGLDAAARFLEPGGELLYIASMESGLGSRAMEPFVAEPEPENILARLEESWVQYGHTTLRIIEKTNLFKVHLVSKMDPSLASSLGFIFSESPDEVLESWRERHPGESVGVVTGLAVYPRRS